VIRTEGDSLATDTSTTPAKLTALDFFHWVRRPENAPKRWELRWGEPIELPTWPDSFKSIQWRMVGMMADYVIRRGFGSVAYSPAGLLTAREPDRVLCPAVMVFLDPTPDEDFPPQFTTEVPHLIIELSPPGESHSLQNRRVGDYVHFGARLVWVVDPVDRCLIQFVPNQPPSVLDESDELSGNGELPEFSCRVADLFTLPGQKPVGSVSPNT